MLRINIYILFVDVPFSLESSVFFHHLPLSPSSHLISSSCIINLIIPNLPSTNPIHAQDPFIRPISRIRHKQLRPQRLIKPFAPPSFRLVLPLRQRRERDPLIHFKGVACLVPRIGDALIEAECCPGGAGNLDIEVGVDE